jgi:hypothetical protein
MRLLGSFIDGRRIVTWRFVTQVYSGPLGWQRFGFVAHRVSCDFS